MIINTNIFIEKAKNKHKNKYDYSKTIYINCKTKIKIICPIHGMFLKLPHNHLQNGQGCMYCSGRKNSKETFTIKANKIHKNRYDYSLVEYTKGKEKIKIICSIHGVFEQVAEAHLDKNGCPTCFGTPKRTNEKFIKEANDVHKYKYDYSLVKYIDNSTEVKIICPKHGVFGRHPYSHINLKSGCGKCNNIRYNGAEEYFDLVKKIYDNFYTYDYSSFKNANEHISITCPIHGIFYMSVRGHLNGHVCPSCRDKSSGEKEVENFLIKKQIKYIFQKRFNDCKNVNTLSFDFYLPELNLCIEYDGKQHYEPIDFYGGDKALKLYKKRDRIKTKYCKNNSINLLRIKYNENVIEKLIHYLVPGGLLS